MKVLWFTDVTHGSIQKKCNMAFEHGPASWIEGLQVALIREGSITLGIAATSGQLCESFVEDGVTYFSVPKGHVRNKLLRVLQRWAIYRDDAALLDASQKIIKEFRPDVIHVHGTENPYGMLINYTDIPIVISLQGLLIQCRRAYFRGLGAKDVLHLFFTKYFLKGSGEIHTYFNLRKRAQREAKIMATNNAFIGRTKWDQAFQQIYSPKARYYHCDEVIRPAFYEKQWSLEQSTPNTIFTTSSSMLFKGTEVILEALGLLMDMGIKNIQVRIAGVPDQGDVVAFLKRKAKEHNVAGSVVWLGRINPEQLCQELLRASLFVYPSHIDNSPNSLVEAMLVGVPCIASYVGGIPSLIQDDIDGWLFPDNDACALAAKILQALQDNASRVSVGNNARKLSLLRNAPEDIAGKMKNIYQSVMTRT